MQGLIQVAAQFSVAATLFMFVNSLMALERGPRDLRGFLLFIVCVTYFFLIGYEIIYMYAACNM